MMDTEKQLGDWYPLVKHLFAMNFMEQIAVKIRKDQHVLEPRINKIFRALELTQPSKVKVVIIGQDPYPFGQADGLAFSSSKVPIPYSLEIIYRELEKEGYGMRMVPELDDWAKEGVLLLNTSLTTVAGTSNAHSQIGWDNFTGYIIDLISIHKKNVVYLIWGSDARNLLERFTPWRRFKPPLDNLVLYAPHPAAQRKGFDFLGCNHFKKCNEYLFFTKQSGIQWTSDLTLKK